MNRATKNEPSSFGREVTLRFSGPEWRVLAAHMREDRCSEQMAFGLAAKTATAEGTLLTVNELILPGRDDLREQSAVGVAPTPEFQAHVYMSAAAGGRSIVEFHTHPGANRPVFSGTDDRYAHENARYMGDALPDAVSLALVVGNNDFTKFDGVIYDPALERFRGLSRIEVLSPPYQLFHLTRGEDQIEEDEQFDRQTRVPSWRQDVLESLTIAVFGLGGNGAHLLEPLVGIGAARRGSLVLIDDDRIELSNLPRIPYATNEQVGIPKVTAAAQYVGRKSPGTPVFPFPCRAGDKAASCHIKTAHVILNCGDNDGLRKASNETAVRYRVPLIDLGCDIQVESQEIAAGGQVRKVLPGENACLVCSGGFDAAQAAIDQMDDRERAARGAYGYVHGETAGNATPSIANLNGLAAHYAIAALLALVNGVAFAPWNYLHFDPITGRTIAATTKRNRTCPMCGPRGVLGAGDPLPDPHPAGRALTRLIPSDTDA